MNNPECAVCLLSLNTDLSPDVELNIVKATLQANGYGHLDVKQVHGRWAGEDELAYVVNLVPSASPELLDVLVSIAKVYKQEEIWVLLQPTSDGRRRAYSLTSPKFDNTNHIGYFVPCTQSKAYTQAGWTFDANTGQHYILEEN